MAGSQLKTRFLPHRLTSVTHMGQNLWCLLQTLQHHLKRRPPVPSLLQDPLGRIGEWVSGSLADPALQQTVSKYQNR